MLEGSVTESIMFDEHSDIETFLGIGDGAEQQQQESLILLSAALVLLIVASIGLVSIYYQCLTLRNKMRQASDDEDPSQQELASQWHRRKQRDQEELELEIRALSEMQAEVASQLVILRQLVTKLQTTTNHQETGDMRRDDDKMD